MSKPYKDIEHDAAERRESTGTHTSPSDPGSEPQLSGPPELPVSLGALVMLAGFALAIFGAIGFAVIGIPIDNPAPSIIGYSTCIGAGLALIRWGERI